MNAPGPETRRDFLRCFVKAGFASLASLAGGLVVTFLYPRKIKKQDPVFYCALAEEDLPRQGVGKVEVPLVTPLRSLTARAFVVNHGGEIFALSAVCRHLGCLVEWSRCANLFICPCHGGKYDIQGLPVSGPPSSPLARIPMKVVDGKVYMGFTAG